MPTKKKASKYKTASSKLMLWKQHIEKIFHRKFLEKKQKYKIRPATVGIYSAKRIQKQVLEKKKDMQKNLQKIPHQKQLIRKRYYNEMEGWWPKERVSSQKYCAVTAKAILWSNFENVPRFDYWQGSSALSNRFGEWCGKHPPVLIAKFIGLLKIYAFFFFVQAVDQGNGV